MNAATTRFWTKSARVGFSCLAVGAMLAVGVIFALYGSANGPASEPPDKTVVATEPARQGVRYKAVTDEPSLLAGPEPAINVGWITVSLDTIEPERLPVRELHLENSVLVALDPTIRQWQEGDPISLTIPQLGATYKTVVGHVETGIGGSRSYIGRLPDAGLYSYVITVGEQSAFAHLGTPQGTFELVGGKELAWLTPGASFERLFDYTKVDYVSRRDEKNRVIRRVGR